MARIDTIIAGVCLGLICLSFLFSLIFTPLSYFLVSKSSDPSRGRAVTWLRISWTLLLVWVFLHFIRLILALAVSPYSTGLLTAQSQLAFVALLILPVALMSVLILQLELALAVRSVSGVSVNGARGPRIAAYVGMGVLIVLSVLRFAANEYTWAVRNFSVSYSSATYYRFGEMRDVLAFVVSLLLLLGAVGTLIHNILTTRATSLRKVFYLVLAMNILTLLRELYQTIYAGIFILGRVTGDFFYTRKGEAGIHILNFVFNPTSTAVVLIMAFFVMHKKERGIWTNGHPAKTTDAEGRSLSMMTTVRHPQV